jgi:UTP--glucose-1-phosphate uridylyltransferase
MLIDRDGVQKSVLAILLSEAFAAQIETCCVVVSPGDEEPFRAAAGEHADRLEFVVQEEPAGYGHAVLCAREFVRDEPFLHMIGDHIYVSDTDRCCAEQLVVVATAQSCAVSAVQPTRETLLPLFGAVGGQRVKGTQDLFLVERVAEKPTPTQAEETLLVPGLRSAHYLCFFGMHVFTPLVMELLARRLAASGSPLGLSPVLDQLAGRERYIALEAQGRRYPLDVPYGLLTAQVALALSGRDREEVLAGLCELLAQRNLGRPK